AAAVLRGGNAHAEGSDGAVPRGRVLPDCRPALRALHPGPVSSPPRARRKPTGLRCRSRVIVVQRRGRREELCGDVVSVYAAFVHIRSIKELKRDALRFRIRGATKPNNGTRWRAGVESVDGVVDRRAGEGEAEPVRVPRFRTGVDGRAEVGD